MDQHSKSVPVAGELQSQRLDYLVATLKSAIGVVPFGGLVAEAIGAAIPHQRIDRMADVVQKVATRVDEIGIQVDDISERFRSPEFTDILEETLLQAGKALSEERRQHLANLLFTGLTTENFDNARLKKLLFVLSELTDPELIWLTFAGLHSQVAQLAFHELHASILDDSIGATIGSDPEEAELAALRESYWQRLNALGLTSQHRGPGLGEITSLGRLLLRLIGAPSDQSFDDVPTDEYGDGEITP